MSITLIGGSNRFIYYRIAPDRRQRKGYLNLLNKKDRERLAKSLLQNPQDPEEWKDDSIDIGCEIKDLKVIDGELVIFT